jgi:murein DD-endopeptidase MepM/ murein hydrolase activator NlpD
MHVKASAFKSLTIPSVLRLRQRYIYTRSNTLRLRYVTGAAFVFVLASGVAVSSLLPKDGAGFVAEYAQNGSEALQEMAALSPEAGYNSEVTKLLQSGISSGIRKASSAMQKPEKPRFREVEIGKGETVAGVLQQAGLDGNEAHQAVKALGKYFDVRKIQSGQKIDLHFRPDSQGEMSLAKMELQLDPIKQVNVVRAGAQDFVAELAEKELVARTHAKVAKIQTSLYGSAARAEIPQSVIAELIRIYSWNIDFQRDIQPGDKIEVLYDSNETVDGDYSRLGDVLYASLTIGGRQIPIYRFEMDNGRVDYFGPDGSSTRKTLMKTPIDGARISSGFGMRRHPVLGYTKMHKGMDFAAPTGTPIYAAGDGKIEYAGRFSSYGNYIKISHNSKLKTAYAHMSRFAKGIKVGTRVKQGQIIGYVGSTGRSTGPHLHYEVLVNNRQVNPKSINLPTGEQLSGKELKRFKSHVQKIRQQFIQRAQGQRYAQAVSQKSGS